MNLLNTPAARCLLEQAVTERDFVVEGSYTNPPTWGVYEIEPPENGRSTRRFRIGNHPNRQRELEVEFGGSPAEVGSETQGVVASPSKVGEQSTKR